MGGEVVHRDLDALALLEFPQSGHQQLKVKGPRVVKVIVITGSQRLLRWRQNLWRVQTRSTQTPQQTAVTQLLLKE